jgi:hypothetical protein
MQTIDLSVMNPSSPCLLAEAVLALITAMTRNDSKSTTVMNNSHSLAFVGHSFAGHKPECSIFEIETLSTGGFSRRGDLSSWELRGSQVAL